MAGFFDFIKKPTDNASAGVTPNVPQGTTTTQSTVVSSGSPSGGQSYNGIGAPPGGGQPYNGIGSPPVQTPPADPQKQQLNNINNVIAAVNQTPVTQTSQVSKPTDVKNDKTVTQPAQSNKTTPSATAPGQKPAVAPGSEPSKSLSSNIDGQKRAELDLMTHLTQRSNRVFLSAQTKAKEFFNQFIDSEHLLHGLLADGEIYKLLTELKIQPQMIETELNPLYKHEANKTAPPQISPRFRRILDNSLVIARKLGFEFISPEHLLLALYEEGEGVGARVLSKLGLKKEDINKKIVGKKEGLMATADQKGLAGGEQHKSGVEQYTIDLTAKAAQGLLDPVVERYEVIERVIHILSRRSKNNPALVGEAGVGKTAIVEGLAQKIVSKQVPESLLNRRILSLDLMAVLAGASHRGEFEERMKNLIEEVKASKGSIILFIDEIHNIMGAGGGEGSSDAANFLKPALSRGEMQLIGATTLTEYRKYIEKDPALERRFQPIVVPEPTEEQAIKMLKATKGKYEAFHRVQIPDSAIEAAVKLSKRYVGDRFLPDKAVDLIDEAGSAVRLPLISLPEEIRSLETRIAELTQSLKENEKVGDPVKARVLRSKIDEVTSDLNEKKDNYNTKKAQTTTAISEQIIKDIVSRWTGIPVSKITGTEMDKLAHLEDIMHKRLIGQEDAVASVAQAVRRGRAGLKSVTRPIGSFVFLGPTGTGKTELAKTLADILFGQEDAMIRFDMTEYMEKHEVAKLLGAPPGYVGYEEGGKLTEAVRRKPYSVVLFDEVEKAHPDIFNILLQILDDGRLTDNKGHTISFKNTVVICTSNIGSRIIQEELMKGGKEQVEEPNVLSSYTFSPRGREVLTMGAKCFQRMGSEGAVQLSASQEEPETFATFAFSPRGRQIATAKNKYFEHDANAAWKNGTLTDYFSGQQIEEDEKNKDKKEKITFPQDLFDTHAISPDGIEMISKGNTLFYRTSTTAKVWKTSNLIDYTKENIVINALPDAPDQELPTAKLQTHAFSPEEQEIITLDGRFWRRKMKSTDWETGLLKDYFVNQIIKPAADKKTKVELPTQKWDIHTYSPTGEEFIIVGSDIYEKKQGAAEWEMKKVADYFGKDYPLQKKEEKKPEVKKEIAKDGATEVSKAWQDGMLLDYFSGQEVAAKPKEVVDPTLPPAPVEKVEFPIHGFDTQSMSPTGEEMITKGGDVFYRVLTTDKKWEKMNLIEYFKKGVVVNALSDAPDEQLPTASLKTHSYSPDGQEVVTFKDRYWKRKIKTNEWQTGFLKDYFTDQTLEKGNFPTTYWDIHTYAPSGKEIVIVGEVVWFRNPKDTKWLMQRIDEYFGKDFPLQKQVEEKLKIDDEIEKKKFGVLKSKVMGELHKFFRPELINRFDEVIIFEPLRFIHMKKIVAIQLKGVAKAMEEQDMGFSCTDAAIKEIVRNGFDPVFGARPLRRAIQKLVENPISSLIIERKVVAGNQVLVDFDGQNFVFNIERTQLVLKEELAKAVKKRYLCEVCANRFENEVIPNSTAVCSKCASSKVQEVFEDPSILREEKQVAAPEEKPVVPQEKPAPSQEKPVEANTMPGSPPSVMSQMPVAQDSGQAMQPA